MTGQTRLTLDARIETLVLKKPFHISGHVFRDTPVLTVALSGQGHIGRGEAAGVYYTGDEPAQMLETLEGLRGDIEAGLSREDLRRLLPAGGARNALDCALWDLEAKIAGRAVWQLAGLEPPRPLLTTMTVGADTPDAMADGARGFADTKAIKLKLTGDAALDAERVRAVRKARPDVWLGVDANQGFTRDTIAPLFAALVDCRVQLLEQPFRRGREQDMAGITFPMPTAADESCLNLAELEQVHQYFDVINIKLDKCGGLTEGLLMAQRARELGVKIMVGCMVGTSRAMAPGFVLGQLCDVVDLDAPAAIVNDRERTVTYAAGEIFSSADVWGGTAAADAPATSAVR